MRELRDMEELRETIRYTVAQPQHKREPLRVRPGCEGRHGRLMEVLTTRQIRKIWDS